jgi:spore germination protein GerM
MTRQLPKPSAFRRVFFAIWGMATLVLFVTVGLLVTEMTERGQNPLTIISESEPPPKREVRAEVQPTDYRNVILYFTNPNGHDLMPERRSIPFSNSTSENCKRALQELMSGPREELLPIVPEDTDILAAFLLDSGKLVINFTHDLKVGAMSSVSAEALMIYGIVNTVSQPELAGNDGIRVNSVQFLVEGAVQTDPFPAHFDLSEPVEPDQRWNATATTDHV